MNSRERILDALRTARQPFSNKPAPQTYLPMAPVADTDSAALTERFVTEAEKLSGRVHRTAGAADAIETVLSLLEGEESIIRWDAERIPLPGLSAALAAASIAVAAPDDPSVRVGLSGADAALAATGSLVLCSDAGQYRTASLLPPVHIAIITADQILPDLESWVARQRVDELERFRCASNIVIVSGPSRTADIAMQLILGMHGPGELHIVLLENT